MDEKLPTRKETGRRNVIFFGDSISLGELVSPHRIWVTRVSERIEQRFGERFLTINCSINGDTTRLALERMPFDVQRYGVAVLIVQFGMNDCNFWMTDEGQPRVSPTAYRANTLEIIRRGIAFGARRILLATSHPTSHKEKHPAAGMSIEESRVAYGRILREIAAEDPAVILVDVERHFEKALEKGASEREFLMPDGIHLNQRGHDQYVDIFSPAVLEAIDGLDD
jgi:acyl-CoA thioesterase-1